MIYFDPEFYFALTLIPLRSVKNDQKLNLKQWIFNKKKFIRSLPYIFLYFIRKNTYIFYKNKTFFQIFIN